MWRSVKNNSKRFLLVFLKNLRQKGLYVYNVCHYYINGNQQY